MQNNETWLNKSEIKKVKKFIDNHMIIMIIFVFAFSFVFISVLLRIVLFSQYLVY